MKQMLVLSIGLGLASGQQAFDKEKELALGRSMTEEQRRRSPSIEDPLLSGYLANLVDRLNQNARSPFPVTIDIVRDASSRQVDALPGGFLRVPLESIARAANEEEVAMALAHGLAHVVRRDGLRYAAQVSGLSTVPLIHVAIHPGDGVLMPQALVATFRQAEEEAERLAAQWASGIEPTGEFEAAQTQARLLAAERRASAPTLRRKTSAVP
jgi:predicted Zn-dependent protease